MGSPIQVTSRASVDDVERRVRTRFAQDGNVVLFATQGGYRQLRRLRRRLQDRPASHGWDLELRASDDERGGGVLVVRLPGNPYPAV